jgi:Ni,Fe-hydrogenase III large subunit/Ni,Fe-hydrogenase III component G
MSTPQFDFSRLQTALAERFGARGPQVVARRSNEAHFDVEREDVAGLASLLRAEFKAELALMTATDRREDRNRFEVHYLFAQERENWFANVTAPVPASDPSIPSLATFYYPASRYEREIKDLFGIEPKGHPDRRPLVRHAFWPESYFPLRKDASWPEKFVDEGKPFLFGEVGGEGVYEIPVGPVHAGIIEPGHFRFSVVGETVIDLKIRLYFTHKGTEKLFEMRAPADGVELAERISGDTSIGHSLAYCRAVESLSGAEVPARAEWMRLILLELERIYNHIADFGMICTDAGFAVAQSHCYRIRERLLRCNKRITGNRLLRGGVVPGGSGCDLPPDLDLARELAEVLADFNEIVEISFKNTMLMDRLEGTGTLDLETGRDHGVSGFVARASGIDADARRDHPFGAYRWLEVRVPVLEAGDVHARTLVRVEEIRESVRLIGLALANMSPGELRSPLGSLPPFEPAFAMVEAWRGAILHWIMADEAGKLARVKIKDPSFVNWPVLSFALLKNIVPDFPLCNKSFNQSYSGNDL